MQNTYKVHDGQPVLVERITEYVNLPHAPKRTIVRLVNGHLREVPEP